MSHDWLLSRQARACVPTMFACDFFRSDPAVIVLTSRDEREVLED